MDAGAGHSGNIGVGAAWATRGRVLASSTEVATPL